MAATYYLLLRLARKIIFRRAFSRRQCASEPFYNHEAKFGEIIAALTVPEFAGLPIEYWPGYRHHSAAHYRGRTTPHSCTLNSPSEGKVTPDGSAPQPRSEWAPWRNILTRIRSLPSAPRGWNNPLTGDLIARLHARGPATKRGERQVRESQCSLEALRRAELVDRRTRCAAQSAPGRRSLNRSTSATRPRSQP